ncbi:MAG: hypothetical protein ACPLYF_02325, partial [Fervidobacterium sp.]
MSEENSMLPAFESFRQKAEPLLDKLSNLRKSEVFPMLFHIQVSIAPWCVSKVYDCIARKAGEIKDMDVVLFSLGGDADTAFHIAQILNRSVKGELRFIVPRSAASA